MIKGAFVSLLSFHARLDRPGAKLYMNAAKTLLQKIAQKVKDADHMKF